jgi:omega-6 fatty acid desaturase (delta-12 desaturase)
MREGRQLVRDTSVFASEQRGRSWWCFSSTLCLLVAAVSVACLQVPWFVRLAASILIGLLHVRLFVIYHDYLHGAILQDSMIARVVFWCYGLITLAPPSIWRQTHDHHHRNNARRMTMDTVGTFPILTIDDYGKAGTGERFIYALSRHPLTIVLGYLSVFFYGFGIQALVQNPRRHIDAAVGVVLHVALLVWLCMIGLDMMLFVVVIPMSLASAFGAYLFYAQHNFPSAKIRPGTDWDYVVAALRSSSFIQMSPVMHWFTANIGYHHIHHLNHHIPFYRLPEAMASMEELQSPGTTSLKPAEILRCLKLNLWDPEEDRLVSFAEGRKKRCEQVVRLPLREKTSALGG